MNLVKKTIFWILVLTALGGAFHFLEQEMQKKREDEAASLKLLSFSVGDVQGFWVADKRAGLRIDVLRKPDGWYVIHPLAAKGDDEAIDKMLLNIVAGRKDAVLFAQPGPEKLRELGLDAPGIEVGFTVAGAETVVSFGDSGPTHNVAYAMLRGEPTVYRVHASVREEANKDVYALRDKRLLDIDPVKMGRLEIERTGEEKIVVTHDKGKWLTLEPTVGLAEMEKVLELLFAIKNARIKGFADETPSGLAAYGLLSPNLEISIYEGDAQIPRVLSIGDKDRIRRGYFAITNQAENVFIVGEDLVNALKTNMANWAAASRPD
jgi:hypothetical protein